MERKFFSHFHWNEPNLRIITAIFKNAVSRNLLGFFKSSIIQNYFKNPSSGLDNLCLVGINNYGSLTYYIKYKKISRFSMINYISYFNAFYLCQKYWFQSCFTKIHSAVLSRVLYINRSISIRFLKSKALHQLQKNPSTCWLTIRTLCSGWNHFQRVFTLKAFLFSCNSILAKSC